MAGRSPTIRQYVNIGLDFVRRLARLVRRVGAACWIMYACQWLHLSGHHSPSVVKAQQYEKSRKWPGCMNLRQSRSNLRLFSGKQDLMSYGSSPCNVLEVRFQLRCGYVKDSLNFSITDHYASVNPMWSSRAHGP